MTGRTRDYLSDLALLKGVSFPGGQEMTQAQASETIEELKLMPDAVFPPISETQLSSIDKGIAKIIRELNKWTFER